MKMIFTKGSGKTDQLDIYNGSAIKQTLMNPKQRIIPHEMVHYAVEHTLQQRGFLHRLSEGEAASFTMASEAEADGVERLVEVIQGDAWSGSSSSATDMLEMYRVTCHARACPMLAVDEAAIDAVRTHMKELSEKWDAVAVGQALELTL
jgi:hypothetical protein